MEQSPAWEDSISLPNQEITHTSGNVKIHYCIHNSLPLLPILMYMEPVHTIPPYSCTIHFNITLPTMPESSRWSPSFSYHHQNPVCFFITSNLCHMPHPAHFPSFPSCDQPNIQQGLQIIGHLIMPFFSSSHYFLQLKAASLLPLISLYMLTLKKINSKLAVSLY